VFLRGREEGRRRSGEYLLKTRTPHLGCGEKQEIQLSGIDFF